ncbi:MAG TPA: hypothetical protein QGH92_03395, partial [Candidatus Parcubacteria bacterium]|nr:hypothetical protein [Candidatus Parcubacteria bacterium]
KSATRRYPKSKSGIIKYNISGTIAGTEVVYYEDWGRREAIYTKTTMDLRGVTVDRNTLTILEDNGRWINNIDLNARTGLRMKNPQYKEYVGKSRVELENTKRKSMKDAGARRAEIERVVGKPCIVWAEQYTGNETYTWNGIILKKVTGSGFSKTTTVATEITESVNIPEGKFTIPPDIQMKTLDVSTFH